MARWCPRKGNQVLIGIDPHKGSHTAVVVDRDEVEIARVTVRADRHQLIRLLAFAEPFGAADLGDRVRRRVGISARPAARRCR